MTYSNNLKATGRTKTPKLGVAENELWKEKVVMDAIRLPRHIYKWNATGMTTLFYK